MPKQLIAVAPRKAELGVYDEMPLLPHEVRVKVEYASPKHGSELAAFRGESPHLADQYNDEWKLFLPRDPNGPQDVVFGKWNLGNQWVGRIVEKGRDVTGYELSERVCGYGGIREYHHVSAIDNFYLLKLPDTMPWQNAVCLDPAIFALGGIRDGHVRAGDRVAVFGLGAIGQIATQLAKLAGASYVAVVDPIENRRRVALKNGADRALDPVHEDVGFLLKEDTGRLGVDVIIETSANEFALNQALRGLAYGGTIAYVGWARPFKGGLDWGREAHFNNAKIVFSRSCSEPTPDHPRWSFRRIEETCWSILKDRKINCEDIISPVIPFTEAGSAYETYVDRNPEKSIKLGVKLAE
jgi:threonine dehydrogenase-like Zn-dependent dehydrogenase